MPPTPRDILTLHLAEQARRFPNLDLMTARLDDVEADPRDVGQARAIEHAVLRQWIALRTVLESQLTRPWENVEEKLQAVLLVGVAQLLLMDRIPDHAVLNEAVGWAKRKVRPGAGAMVNAVLRKVAALRGELIEGKVRERGGEEFAVCPYRADELPRSDGMVWRLSAPVFDADPMTRLMQQTSHTPKMHLHWQAARGAAEIAALALHSLVPAPIVVAGLRDVSERDDLAAHDVTGFHVFSGSRAGLDELLAAHPEARVQDIAASEALRAARGGSYGTIVDFCAGRGTKSRQALAMFPESNVVASDTNDRRRAELAESLAGSDRATVVQPGGWLKYAGKADLLLLDVPCSNSGVLARRVEAKYRLDGKSIAELVDVQRQIVADSLMLMSDHGHLLYTTCSVEAAENEQMVEWLCEWHRMRVVRSGATKPTGWPGDAPTSYRDGGFHALLERG